MPPRKRKPNPVEAMRHADDELDKLLIEEVPTTFNPGYDGYKLRLTGTPWAEVAEQIGSPSAGAASRTVSKYLAEAALSMSATQQQEVMQLRVGQYETILQKWWARGVDGQDVNAASVVLRVLDRLDRLQRLTDGDVILTKETLVISADPTEYVRQLRQVVEERTPEDPNN